MIRGLAAVLAVLAAGGVLAMMLVTMVDVLKRTVTGRSLAGAQEVTESLIVAVVWFGFAWAQYTREHVAVDLLTRRLGVRAAAVVRLAGQLTVLGLAGWMMWRTGANAWGSFESGELRFGLLQVPMWPARTAIPLGLLAFVLVVLVDACDQARSLIGRTPTVEPVHVGPLG
jgi:TRAP-type C4-dicarboxylate transport system permease small subunit